MNPQILKQITEKHPIPWKLGTSFSESCSVNDANGNSICKVTSRNPEGVPAEILATLLIESVQYELIETTPTSNFFQGEDGKQYVVCADPVAQTITIRGVNNDFLHTFPNP